MEYLKKYTFLTLLFLCIGTLAHATHIRAGEIIAERVSCVGFKYRITIIGYEDTGSDVIFGNGILDLGFGDIRELSADGPFVRTIIDPEKQVRRSSITLEIDFPAAGRYIISYNEQNRNEDISNIPNSVNTPFYVETKLFISATECNNSPILTNPPVEGAVIGQTFLHNPGAVDKDGDSLSYEFVLPKDGQGSDIVGYDYPALYDIQKGLNPNPTNQAGTGPPTITLDPITGELRWDAPANPGEYNVAFIVKEWRKIDGEWVELGYVTRDMQIIVEDAENEPPVITIPTDTCIEAGTLLEAIVRGEDPDGNDIALTGFGSVFEFVSSPATFSPITPQPSPAEATFVWQTNRSHIQAKPYQINFKAREANPATGPPLADFGIWNVTVVAPAPEGLTADVLPPSEETRRSVGLNWLEYETGGVDSIKIEVWRKVDSSSFVPENCQLGIPEGEGYKRVAVLGDSVNTYVDETVAPGVNYCYRLVAVYPDGSESYASGEACAQMALDASVITKVSVLTTDTENGSIRIDWRSPLEIDTLLFPPPYTYQVVRGTGFSGGETVVVSGILSDTTFVDTGLNTLNEPYHYTIYLFDAGSTEPLDSSAVASSVYLEPTSQVGSIALSWSAQVPWSNQSPDYAYHYVYRNRVDPDDAEALVLIDSVNVLSSGLNYTDDGAMTGGPLSDELEYCYFVTTVGSYGNVLLNPPPIINNSQVACAQPNDTIPPCEPLAIMVPNASLEDCQSRLAGEPCDVQTLSNRLEWEENTQEGCDNDVRSYNVYFSATGEDADLNLLANTSSPFFEHENLTSLAGCYRIAAVDRSGNESSLSEPVCVENCPNYELPNVFTPNGDNINDTFRTFDGSDGDFSKCPRFVESVLFTVYNRWGKEVYDFSSDDTESSIIIDWDGRTEGGTLLSPGIYYYTAEVKYITLDPVLSEETLKGWVQILYTQDDL